MQVKELFEQSIKGNFIDLQTLIMFLVFEKEVLSMDDDTKRLDIYFLEKHNERMNRELASYKEKMNIKYGPQVYELTGNKTFYILAFSQKQAEFIAYENLISYDSIKTCDLDQMMHYNGKDMTFRSLILNKKVGVLGGFDEVIRPNHQIPRQ